MARASRPSRARILADLRVAARRGDRAALALAVDHMKTLAFSPRYWERYFELLSNPLARLIDLLVIKQGERIARLKGWKLPASAPPRGPRRAAAPRPEGGRRRPRAGADAQPTLFEL